MLNLSSPHEEPKDLSVTEMDWWRLDGVYWSHTLLNRAGVQHQIGLDAGLSPRPITDLVTHFFCNQRTHCFCGTYTAHILVVFSGRRWGKKGSHKSLSYYCLSCVTVSTVNFSHLWWGIFCEGMMTCVLSGSPAMGNADCWVINLQFNMSAYEIQVAGGYHAHQ